MTVYESKYIIHMGVVVVCVSFNVSFIVLIGVVRFRVLREVTWYVWELGGMGDICVCVCGHACVVCVVFVCA